MIRIQDTSAQDVMLAPKLRTRPWIRWAVVGLCVVLLLGLIVKGVTRLLSADITVSRERLQIAQVEKGDFVRDVSAQGKVVAAVSPTVYAPAEGMITLEVQAGDLVKKDQLLAVIESPELKSRYAQEQATLDSMQIEVSRQRIQTRKAVLKSQQTIDLAEVKLIAAQREQERAEQSIQKQVISRIDYEQAGDNLNAAKLEHEHAVQDAALEKESLEFELKTKVLQLDRQQLLVAELQRQVQELDIRSPVSGMIGNIATQQKAAVARNAPLLTVVDLSVYEIEVQVPESYADDLGMGMQTEIMFGQISYTGILTAVSPEVVNNQVTARMRFEGATPEGLRQNQRVTARILIEAKQNILKVRRGTFLDNGAGRYAYVVQDNLARRTPVQIGSRGIHEVEIVDGLHTGDYVIISNTDLFQNAEIVYLTN